jgi:hypothetical protein
MTKKMLEALERFVERREQETKAWAERVGLPYPLPEPPAEECWEADPDVEDCRMTGRVGGQ